MRYTMAATVLTNSLEERAIEDALRHADSVSDESVLPLVNVRQNGEYSIPHSAAGSWVALLAATEIDEQLGLRVTTLGVTERVARGVLLDELIRIEELELFT